jgi:hypothetical protein
MTMSLKYAGCELTPIVCDNINHEISTTGFYLTEDGRYGIGQECNYGNGCTPDVYHRRTIEFNTRILTESVADYLQSDDGIAIIQRIHDENLIEWDGRNMVGHLTSRGREAIEELESALEKFHMFPHYADDVWTNSGAQNVWTWREYIETSDIDDCGITAQTTDVELDKIVGDLIESTVNPTLFMIGSAHNEIYQIREDLIGEAYEEEIDEDDDNDGEDDEE